MLALATTAAPRPVHLLRAAAAHRLPSAAALVNRGAVRAMAGKVQPQEAAALLEDASAGWTYLDVRTPQEFQAGRVKGSTNIPLMLSTPAGMQPNPEFLAQVQQAFPAADARLVVACKAGNRSARACAALAEASYANLVDQTGGFDGWVAVGLPVEQ